MTILTQQHYELISYIHSCILSAHSRINPACLRCNPDRHPEEFARYRGLPCDASVDDWDRLADLVAAGIIPTMPGAPVSGGMLVRFTPQGQQIAKSIAASSPAGGRS